MRIAVNTRLLLKNQMDGIGVATFESFKKIVAKNPNVEFIFIFDREPNPDFLFASNIKAEVIGPQARHPFLYKIWYQYSLKNLLKKIKPDIFIGTDGMIPLNTSTITLSIIHDLNFEHHPEHLPFLLRRFYCKNFPKFASRANRIATVSEFSKQDIIKTYNINANKIDVIFNGPNEDFKPLSEDKKIVIKKQYSENKPYFLFVGTLHPRKNIAKLFEAFDDFKTKTKSDIKLLIVGKKMWWTNELENSYKKLTHKNDIIFAGRVSSSDLYKITASAYALTYVPFFEGFGIPLVEAMSCGIPVIASNVTSMPEVVGNAGILVNPNSVEEISAAMQNIFSDNELRTSLSQKSLVQAKNFSWNKTANLLWESIQKTINA